MLDNRKGDMTPYDMSQKPCRQNPFLLPLVWGASWLATRRYHLKIDRRAVKGLKPPYLLLAVHQGFTDYYIAPLALFPHRANYVSDVEGFAAFGKSLYRQVGCLAKRRFTSGLSLIRSIRWVTEHNRNILVLYPEARHCNVGTNTVLPPSIGKLVKKLNLPVVLLREQGSYLATPLWDESHPRRVPVQVKLELVDTPETLAGQSAEAVTARLNRLFAYDEYRWQWENKIRIDYPRRAEGLHKALYLCPRCGAEYRMDSKGAELFCAACGKRWRMDEYGRLAAAEGETEFPHIPDWYEFERAAVEKEIAEGNYFLRVRVRIEALPNEKGFVPMGEGTLEHRPEGFRLSFDSGEALSFSSLSMDSVQTEYDYRGRGTCLVLSNLDCCYYTYPLKEQFNVTKIQFAAEEFHRLARQERERKPAAVR